MCTYLHTLSEAFQVLEIKFPPIRPKISVLFIPQCSYLNDLKKKRCKEKQVKKNAMVAES